MNLHELQAHLTGERYRDFVTWLQSPERPGMCTRFQAYDKDQSGRIGREELVAALSEWTGGEIPAYIIQHWEASP
jgi:Ca2+-binding EF-hand superfamily protein